MIKVGDWILIDGAGEPVLVTEVTRDGRPVVALGSETPYTVVTDWATRKDNDTRRWGE